MRYLTGSKKTLGQAIKDIPFEIHPALVNGWSALFGYTSDGDGIRHGLTEESMVAQDEAIYWIVSCSAFVSYLIARALRESS